MRHSYNAGPCKVCGRMISGAGFARKSHERMHVREGTLIEVWRWSWSGNKLGESRIIMPEKAALLAPEGYFPTFEACKAYHNVPTIPKAK